jgi:hypothetical protein
LTSGMRVSVLLQGASKGSAVAAAPVDAIAPAVLERCLQ